MSLWNWVKSFFDRGDTDTDKDGEFLPTGFENIPSDSADVEEMMEWDEEGIRHWTDASGTTHEYLAHEPEGGGELRRGFDFAEDAESYVDEIGAGASYFDIVVLPGGGFEVWYNPD